jgi:hypothetical protein
MEQCEKAIMETDQTSRKGQVKGTYPKIPYDLPKSDQSAQQRCPDVLCEYATRGTDQTSGKRQVKGTCRLTCLNVLKVPSSDFPMPPLVRKSEQGDLSNVSEMASKRDITEYTR